MKKEAAINYNNPIHVYLVGSSKIVHMVQYSLLSVGASVWSVFPQII